MNFKNIKSAKTMGAPTKEARREARDSSTTEGNTTTFNNGENRLPKARNGQQYIETDIGRGRVDRGRERIVSLVESGTGRVLKQYATDDHYSSFR